VFLRLLPHYRSQIARPEKPLTANLLQTDKKLTLPDLTYISRAKVSQAARGSDLHGALLAAKLRVGYAQWD